MLGGYLPLMLSDSMNSKVVITVVIVVVMVVNCFYVYISTRVHAHV